MAWITGFFGRSVHRETALLPAQQQVLANWRQLPEANMNNAHVNTRYVVVDVETSGLDMKKDRLISTSTTT